MYGIVLKNDNRIGAVYMSEFIPGSAVQVDHLPDGNLCDYVYVDGEFVYDPLLKPEQPEVAKPTQEERITQLEEELKATEILLGVSE